MGPKLHLIDAINLQWIIRGSAEVSILSLTRKVLYALLFLLKKVKNP